MAEDAGTEQAAVGFRVRRGRLKVRYRFSYAEFEMELDASSSGVSLKNGIVELLLLPRGGEPTLRLRMGQFKVPFGWETPESSSRRYFPERYRGARHLFPGERDVGAALRWDPAGTGLRLELALLNGAPLKDAYRRDFPLLSPRLGKELVGRLLWHWGPLRLGLSGLWGQGRLPAAQDDPATPRDETHPALDFPRWGAGLLVRWAPRVPGLGETLLQAEAVVARNLARKSPDDYPSVDDMGALQDRTVWTGYVAAVQQLVPVARVGVRYAYWRLQEPQGDASQERHDLTPLLVVEPERWLRFVMAWRVRLEEPTDNTGWFRAQLKF